jgi:hypothetical protein
MIPTSWRSRTISIWAVLLIAAGCLSCSKPDRQASQETATEPRDNESGAASQEATSPDARLISDHGIGGIRLGMTFDEARRALSTAKFERTSDGDGAALVEVSLAPNDSVTLWADEDDPDAPIDWSRKIGTIETFSAGFHTAEGVHPGSLVTDVEHAFGKTREIEQSEIESREYIFFEKQPAGLTFRLDYTGIFPAGSRRTTKFQPGGKIFSIAVSSNAAN